MDLSQNAVLYGDVMLPQEAFYTTNTLEMKLVAGIFETAKSIAELKLTETELALYQSLVLLWPGKIKGKASSRNYFCPTAETTALTHTLSFQSEQACGAIQKS